MTRPTHEPAPEIGDACSLEDDALLSAQLHRFNVDATGVDDGRELVGFVRDPDGSIVAGISGWTAPDLYRDEGYRVVTEVADSPFAPHRHLFMTKLL